MDLIGIPKKNLAAAGNDESSVFALSFMPAFSKRKVKLNQMEEDSWENSLLCRKRLKELGLISL